MTLAPNAAGDIYRTPTDVLLEVDGPSGLLANDTPGEGGTLVVDQVDVSMTRGTVMFAADGSFTYQPPEGGWGRDEFRYVALDPAGATAEAVVTLNVMPTEIPIARVQAGEGGYELSLGDNKSIAGIGDVDADGVGDLVVDALPRTVAVVFGSASNDAVPLDAVDAIGRGYSIQTPLQSQRAESVAGLGDINGDGVPDVGIAMAEGAVGAVDVSLRAYVVFGKASTDVVDASTLDEDAAGFEIIATAASENDTVVLDIDGVGDMNGDGLGDFVVGASRVPDTGQIRAWIVFGKEDTSPVQLSTEITGADGFVIDGETPFVPTGKEWVDGAGDVNGDGVADVVIGCSDYAEAYGRAYVVHGKADGVAVALSDVAAGVGGFAIASQHEPGDPGFTTYLGQVVAGVGDVNGDGLDDVGIGAWGTHVNAASQGRAYVAFGKLDGDMLSVSDLAAGNGGFAVDGFADDRVGWAIDGGHDVNGDGRADLIFGAEGDSHVGDSAGRVYVLYGHEDPGSIHVDDLTPELGFTIVPQGPYNFLGTSVALAEDVNGDGLDDILLGLDRERTGYVIHGVSTAPF